MVILITMQVSSALSDKHSASETLFQARLYCGLIHLHAGDASVFVSCRSSSEIAATCLPSVFLVDCTWGWGVDSTNLT